MKIKEIMHSKPFSLHRNDNLSSAAQIMWERDVGVLPVTDQDDHVIGVITDRDIAMAAFTQGKILSEIPVERSMSKNLYSCNQDDELEQAQAMMQQHQVRRIPILDNNKKLAGMLSLNDIACEYSARPKKNIKSEMVAETLAAICKHRPFFNITKVA